MTFDLDFDFGSDIDTFSGQNTLFQTGQLIPQSDHESESVLPVQEHDEWHQEYPRFRQVFIIVKSTRDLDVDECKLQSLFLVIRIKKGVPVLKSNNVYCTSTTADFNCGYSLDFERVPEFELGSFTPVIELHKKSGLQSELIGIAFLPLKVMSIETLLAERITFFYRDSVVQFCSIEDGRQVAIATVTFAFGFPRHGQLFNCSGYVPTQCQVQGPDPEENIADVAEAEAEAEREKNGRKERRKRRRARERQKRWQNIATAMGWKQPGFVSADWKSKARKVGWLPPSTTLYSSIQVSCDIHTPVLLLERQTQTVLDAPEHVKAPLSFIDDEDDDGDVDNLNSLIGLLNMQQKKPKQSNRVMSPPKCVVDLSVTRPPPRSLVSFGTLFTRELECGLSDPSDVGDIEQSIHELVQGSIGVGRVAEFMESDIEEEEEDKEDYPRDDSLLDEKTAPETDSSWASIINIDPEIQRLLDIANNA